LILYYYDDNEGDYQDFDNNYELESGGVLIDDIESEYWFTGECVGLCKRLLAVEIECQVVGQFKRSLAVEIECQLVGELVRLFEEEIE
ncbi:MAG: hypothetical protein EZS28_049602, partial [Streblomastix strix]